MSRLDVIVASARARQPFTHFLSIPLNSPALQEAFLNFQEEVLLLSYYLNFSNNRQSQGTPSCLQLPGNAQKPVPELEPTSPHPWNYGAARR